MWTEKFVRKRRGAYRKFLAPWDTRMYRFERFSQEILYVLGPYRKKQVKTPQIWIIWGMGSKFFCMEKKGKEFSQKKQELWALRRDFLTCAHRARATAVEVLSRGSVSKPHRKKLPPAVTQATALKQIFL